MNESMESSARREALDHAVRISIPGQPHTEIIKSAAEYYAFLIGGADEAKQTDTSSGPVASAIACIKRAQERQKMRDQQELKNTQIRLDEASEKLAACTIPIGLPRGYVKEGSRQATVAEFELIKVHAKLLQEIISVTNGLLHMGIRPE